MTRYIKLENGYNPVEYSIEQFIEDYPDADICDSEFQETSEELLKQYDVHKLHEAVKPILPGNYVEGPPIFIEGKWIQSYIKPRPAPWEE
jgi:hypothetical protein